MNFDAKEYVKNVERAADYIRKRTLAYGLQDYRFYDFKPAASLTLGSGLGRLAEQIEGLRIPYSEIPNLPELTAEGHRGNGEMVVGFINHVPIIGLVGRKHFYEVAQEPYGMMEVVFMVHVMASLGVPIYISTNAVGGLNREFQEGDLMIIKDHLEYGSMPNPLTGPQLDFGESNKYFQAMHTAYDRELRKLFKDASDYASPERPAHEGIYTALTGRTYETAATCRALRWLDVSTVGMSTTPEIIVATNRGMRTLAISTITNVIAEDGTNDTSSEEVLGVTNDARVKDRLTETFLTFFQLGRERGIF